MHCALGINRSATICVGYLMSDQKYTLLRAVQTVKDKRNLCLTNKGFQIQLITYARRKRLLDPLPLDQREITRKCVQFDDRVHHYKTNPPQTEKNRCRPVEHTLHKYTERERDYRDLYGRSSTKDTKDIDFFSRYIDGRMKDLSLCTALLCGNNSDRDNHTRYQPITKSSFSYDKNSYRY